MVDGSVFAPGFGVYSTTTQNQNKRNIGYNNSLNEGGNYSTTLGGNWSTVAGGNFSTTGGGSMSTIVGANLPMTIGGKIEMIIPFSVKWTLGLYDYDFKYVTNLIKNVSARNQYTNNVVTNDYKGYYGTTTKVTPKDEEFVSQATKLLGVKTETITTENRKVVNSTSNFGTLTTNIMTSSVEKVATGRMQKSSLRTEIGGFSYCKIGCTAPGGGVLSMVPGGATLKGIMIKIG